MISPVDGTARLPLSTVNLGSNPGILSGAMFVNNSGSFLYVAQVTGDNVVAYSIDQVTGALTQVQGPFTNVSFPWAPPSPIPWARTFTLSLPSAAAFTFIKSTSSLESHGDFGISLQRRDERNRRCIGNCHLGQPSSGSQRSCRDDLSIHRKLRQRHGWHQRPNPGVFDRQQR